LETSNQSPANQTNSGRSSFFRTIVLLSHIGNFFTVLVFLFLLIGAINSVGTSTKQTEMFGFQFASMSYLKYVSMGVLFICLLTFIGVFSMKRGKRRGFFIYAIPNGIWACLLFYFATDATSLKFFLQLWSGLTVLFIILFATLIPKLS
jgi:hypothetical protein